MERLTTRHCDKAVIKDKGLLSKAMEKLAYYEDLEEQGLLLKLPCKVGDDVYCFWTTYDFHMDEIATEIIKEEFELAMLEEVSKTVFLTKAEAEKALEEME